MVSKAETRSLKFQEYSGGYNLMGHLRINIPYIKMIMVQNFLLMKAHGNCSASPADFSVEFAVYPGYMYDFNGSLIGVRYQLN